MNKKITFLPFKKEKKKEKREKVTTWGCLVLTSTMGIGVPLRSAFINFAVIFKYNYKYKYK